MIDLFDWLPGDRIGEPTAHLPFRTDKGHFDGACNRRACQRPITGNSWFNRFTSAYYCESCALRINEENPGDADAPACRRVTKAVTIGVAP